MGNRISIQFVDEDNFDAPVLFSHWGGLGLLDDARYYLRDLKAEIKNKPGLKSMPLGRLEPETITVDFIRHLTKNMDRVEGDLYLAKDETGGDNSDNGHHLIKVHENY